MHRAVGYFFREAVVNLARSWKISLVAVSTIAVSLFIGGALLLLIGNLQRLVGEWRSEAKVIVYLRPGLPAAAAGGLTAALRQPPWVTDVRTVSAAEARRRFARYFPSVAELVEGWERSRCRRRSRSPSIPAASSRAPSSLAAAGCAACRRWGWSTTTATGWRSSRGCCR